MDLAHRLADGVSNKRQARKARKAKKKTKDTETVK
jgi:hypothetical protein